MLRTHYTFQEDSGGLHDHSGKGYDAVSINGVTQGATGILGGSAYDFDGTDDYVDLPDTFDRSASHVVTAWIYPRDTTSQQMFWGEDSGNDGDRDYLRIGFTSGELDWFVESGGGANTVISTPITANEWVHVAGVVDYGASETRLYKNGELVGTGSYVSSAGDLGTTQEFGRYPPTPDYYYDGKIADFRIYDHILTPAEISYLASVGATGTLLTASKTHGSAVSPNLRADVTLNSQAADAYVIGSPGTSSEEVQHTSLSAGSNDYSLSWSGTHTDFRVQVETDITVPNRVVVNRVALLV